jgi:hypothetical protein
MAAKLTRLFHKIKIKLHIVAESCTIYSSRSRRSVRKLSGYALVYLDVKVKSLCFYAPRHEDVLGVEA